MESERYYHTLKTNGQSGSELESYTISITTMERMDSRDTSDERISQSHQFWRRLPTFREKEEKEKKEEQEDGLKAATLNRGVLESACCSPILLSCTSIVR